MSDHFESEAYVLSSAVGHLLQLCLPEGVEVDERGFRVVGEGSSKRSTLAAAVKRAWRRQGMTKAQVEETWTRYKEANPEMGRGGGHRGGGASRQRQQANPPAGRKVVYVKE